MDFWNFVFFQVGFLGILGGFGGVMFGGFLEAMFIVFNTVLEVLGGGFLDDVSAIC